MVPTQVVHSPRNDFRGVGTLLHLLPAWGFPAHTHGSLDLGMRVPSSLILSLMLNRLRRSTLKAGERKNGKELSIGQGGKRNWGVGQLLQGGAPPKQVRVQSKAGPNNMLAKAHTLTHLGCDCLSSAVPSKGPWPLSLEESGSGQGLWAQEKWRAALLLRQLWWAQAGKVTFTKTSLFLLFFKKPW